MKKQEKIIELLEYFLKSKKFNRKIGKALKSIEAFMINKKNIGIQIIGLTILHRQIIFACVSGRII